MRNPLRLHQTRGFTLALVIAFVIGLGLSVWFAGLDLSLPWTRLELGSEEDWTAFYPNSFFHALLHTIRFPIFCFLCGFLRRGPLLDLGALAVRGFFLGYTVSVLLLSYGSIGLWLALVLLIFHGFLILPLLFYTAAYSIGRCVLYRDRTSFRRLQESDVALGSLILLVCLLCAVLETCMTPALLSYLAIEF